MPKLTNDKYYTPPELAARLTDMTLDIIGRENISEIIEPAAGNGSFHNLFLTYKAYDIEPESPYIIKQDYLTLEEEYKKGRLYIGNPPFGPRNSMSLKFLKKHKLHGDYIAYIQPIQMLDGSLQFYEFDLIHSEDLGIINYSGVELRCCFNIWSRPKNNILNKKPNLKLKDVVIKEYRRNTTTYSADKITPDFDYSMCNWGSGTLGKIPKHVGEFSQEAYFYLNDKTKRERLKEVLEFNRIRCYCNNISMKRICVARLYKYLKENGFE